MKVQLLNIERIYQVSITKTVLHNTARELKVNKVEEVYLMIVVSQWQFRFKIAKIPSIPTEAASYLVVEKILKRALIKIIFMQLLDPQHKSSLTPTKKLI